MKVELGRAVVFDATEKAWPGYLTGPQLVTILTGHVSDVIVSIALKGNVISAKETSTRWRKKPSVKGIDTST